MPEMPDVREDDVSVMVAEDRRLLMQVKSTRFQANMSVLHSPDSSYDVGNTGGVERWWYETEEKISQNVDAQMPSIYFVDANQRVYTQVDGVTGDALDNKDNSGNDEWPMIRFCTKNGADSHQHFWRTDL